jgi:hypothetical protein
VRPAKPTRVKDHRNAASDEKLSDGGYVSVAQVYVKDSCLHQVLFNEHKSFTHASRGPNHFASSFFDSQARSRAINGSSSTINTET